MSAATESDEDALIGAQGSALPPSVQAGIPRLGATPDGWTRVRLGDVLHPIWRPADIQDRVTYQLVTAKRSRAGIVPRERLLGSQIKVKDQYFVHAGDFIMSNRQISHGGCGLVPPELDGAIVSGEYTTLAPSGNVTLQFLNHLANSVYFQQICFHSSIGVHVEKLVFKLDTWLDWRIDLPPPEEQRNITDALGAWDRAISLSEAARDARANRLRQLRLQLLLQKTVPESVPKRWKRVPLGDAVRVVKRSVPWNDDHDYRLLSVKRAGGGVIHRATRRGAAIAVKKMQAVHAGDLVLSNMQVSHGAMGCVPDQFNGFNVSEMYTILEPRPGYSYRFLAWLLRCKRMWHEAYLCSVGVHIEKMTFVLERFLETPVLLPEHIGEQNWIADVLDTADADHSQSQKMLELLQVQKRALMQKLLSGEYRLRRNKIGAEVAA